MARSTFIVAAVCLCACSATTEDKLGDRGEACQSDNDCRLLFLCIDGECSGGNTACDLACSVLTVDCGATLPGCIGQCASATAGFSDERLDDYVSCIADASCSSAVAAPYEICTAHDCDSVCIKLSQCGLETYEDCSNSCSDNTAGWTRAEFADFEQCFFDLNCGDLGEGADACFPDT